MQLFEFEAGAFEYNLAVKYAGLREHQTTNKALTAAAMGRLLRKALLALVMQEEARRKKIAIWSQEPLRRCDMIGSWLNRCPFL